MDHTDKVSTSEYPKSEQVYAVAPHAQEIEYALILQRMINLVNEDPAQMRVAIYQLARAKLKTDAAWADEGEKKRLTTALETAIQGVEKFSIDRNERLAPAHFAGQIGSSVPGAMTTSIATVVPVTPAAEEIAPRRVTPPFDPPPVLDVRSPSLTSTLGPICVAMLLFFAVGSLAYYKQHSPLLSGRLNPSKPIAPSTASPSIEDDSQKALARLDTKSAAERSPNSLPFPVPTNYGMYAVNHGALSELSALQVRVPDKRIAISTPITEPSRTTLADGKAKFILFRRNLAGDAPERVDVRVVARVNRVLTFDSKGRPDFSPVSGAWNIRNIAYGFRVQPIAGNTEMLLVQSETSDFALPAGRYVLVVKDQGYDFTVAGKITDVAQCLERTDAANGSFFSECQRP